MTGVSEETWRSPECEVDGSPLLGTDYCTPKGPVPQPPAFVGDPCEGLELCAATYEELEAAGHDTSAMRAADERALADLRRRGLPPPSPGGPAAPGPASSAGAAGAGTATYYGAWVNFHLYPGYNCDGTLRYNNFCGWLYHKYTTDGWSTYTTPFPARSGNNVPSYDWVPNVGPIPNEYQWTWGFMNGSFTGFEYDYSDTFYPGKWRLDPWSVSYGGVTGVPSRSTGEPATTTSGRGPLRAASAGRAPRSRA